MSEKTANRHKVIDICRAWVKDGLGDTCFWEGWPGQPDCADLTPNMVLSALEQNKAKTGMSDSPV